jgi:hypothetical protein
VAFDNVKSTTFVYRHGDGLNTVKGLSDKDLLDRLHPLVRQEQDLTLDIVLHLVEIEERGRFWAVPTSPRSQFDKYQTRV